MTTVRMKARTLVAWSAIFVALSCRAQDPIAEAVDELRHVRTFALGQVGFIGHISQGELRYRSILRSDGALKRFTELLASPDASIESRLYAACGVRQLAPADFDGMVRELKNSRGSASVLRTDILNKEPVDQLVRRIGKYGCETTMTMLPDSQAR